MLPYLFTVATVAVIRNNDRIEDLILIRLNISWVLCFMNLTLRLMVYVLISVMETLLITVYSIRHKYFIVWKCLLSTGFSVVYGIKLLNMHTLFKTCILSLGFFSLLFILCCFNWFTIRTLIVIIVSWFWRYICRMTAILNTVCTR